MATATETRVVGQAAPRGDAVERVTGKAVYGSDLTLPGTLYGKMLRSPHAHARIKSINTTRAMELPGVKIVVTSADFPDVELGGPAVGGEIALLPRDQRRMQLADETVFYQGQAVAAVAAISRQVAEDALELIDVEYEVLPTVGDVEEAIKPDAPLVHEDLYTWEFTGEKAASPSNISRHVAMSRGDVDSGFAEADIILEKTFRGGTVHQGYIEPQACTADIDASGHITVYTTNQSSFAVRDALSAVLGLPKNKITLVPLEIGGGFGGKSGLAIELVTTLLAMKSGRPVKLTLTREEVFRATGPTCANVVHLRMGAKKDGTLTAFKGSYYLDTGALAGFPHAATAGMTAISHYKVPNMQFDGYDVVTNKPVHMAYRAPSGPIGNYPTEALMDEIAEQLNIDPIDLRLKNVNDEGGPLPNGLTMPVWGLRKILETAKTHPAWTSPLPPGRGRGFSCAFWGGATLTSSAGVVVNADATFAVTIGSVDLTGVRTSMAQIAAEELGVELDQVTARMGDTDGVGYTDGTFGSRTTLVTGAAVQNAAQETLKKLQEKAAQFLEVVPEDLMYSNQTFSAKDDESKQISLREVCTRSIGGMFGSMEIVGSSTGLPMAPSSAAAIAEVEIDEDTGRTRIARWTAFQDPGKAINPMAVEGQMQGGAGQGVGWALWEVYDWQDGVVRNASLLDYRMPTALDVPMIETVIVETPNPSGPFGVRGAGEACLITPVPAIANAIHSAVGIRLQETPFTPTRVLQALKEKK